jgi:uncharacterized protein YceH (UPF0502 family)
LQFLIDKFPPLVARLARAPGTKESRYAQLLTGEEYLERQEMATTFSSTSSIDNPRHDRISNLENEVSELRARVASLTQQFADFKKQFE